MDADGRAKTVDILTNGATDTVDLLAPTDIKFALDITSATSTSNSGNLVNSGTVLGTLAAVDTDSSSWTYTLSGSDAGKFSLTPATGAVSTLNVGLLNLTNGGDANGDGIYTFGVTATDGAGHSYSESYNVWVGKSGSDGSSATPILISAGSDIDFGLNGADVINGGGGDDAIVGGVGSDTINGGLGNDMLVGGSGNDLFVFNSVLNSTTNVDRLGDFDATNANSSGDTVALDHLIFANIGLSGVLAAGDFISLASGGLSDAVGAGVNIIYDRTTGNLFYDSDGGSNANRVLFANLTASGTVDATDFVVI